MLHYATVGGGGGEIKKDTITKFLPNFSNLNITTLMKETAQCSIMQQLWGWGKKGRNYVISPKCFQFHILQLLMKEKVCKHVNTFLRITVLFRQDGAKKVSGPSKSRNFVQGTILNP